MRRSFPAQITNNMTSTWSASDAWELNSLFRRYTQLQWQQLNGSFNGERSVTRDAEVSDKTASLLSHSQLRIIVMTTGATFQHIINKTSCLRLRAQKHPETLGLGIRHHFRTRNGPVMTAAEHPEEWMERGERGNSALPVAVYVE